MLKPQDKKVFEEIKNLDVNVVRKVIQSTIKKLKCESYRCSETDIDMLSSKLLSVGYDDSDQIYESSSDVTIDVSTEEQGVQDEHMSAEYKVQNKREGTCSTSSIQVF